MSLLEKSIEVRLLTEPNLNEALDAWNHSRPNEIGATLEQVLTVDVPVNEFPRLTFQVTVPILLREWIVSFRDHTIWARTSRAEDLSTWGIWKPVLQRYQEPLEQHYWRMVSQQDQPQDHFRGNLPLAYMTTMSMGLSFRSLVKMFLACGEEISHLGCPQLFSEFLVHLLLALPEDLQLLVKAAMEKYSGTSPLTRNYTGEGDYSKWIAGFVTVGLTGVSLSLRAQLARHRALLIRDNLSDLFNFGSMTTTISDPNIELEFTCTQEAAEAIVVKRNCWIAQEDLWSPVVKAINDALGQSDGSIALPCSDGSCPFVRDNELRLADQDPAPPCPRYANLFSRPLSPEHRTKAENYLGLKPNTRAFWEGELAQ